MQRPRLSGCPRPGWGLHHPTEPAAAAAALGLLVFFFLCFISKWPSVTKETKKMPLGGLGGGEVSLLCRCRCGCPCARLVDSCRHAMQGLLCLVFVCSLCLFGLVCILRVFFAFKEKKVRTVPGWVGTRDSGDLPCARGQEEGVFCPM